MSDPQYVRVRDTELSRHLTLPKSWADAESDRYQVLTDHDAVDVNGKPLPPKYSVADEKVEADDKSKPAPRPATSASKEK